MKLEIVEGMVVDFVSDKGNHYRGVVVQATTDKRGFPLYRVELPSNGGYRMATGDNPTLRVVDPQ